MAPTTAEKRLRLLELEEQESAEMSAKSRSKGPEATKLDKAMALLTGVGYGVPGSKQATQAGRYLGEKITGEESPPSFEEKAPGFAAVGEGIGMIPEFVAGGAALSASKVPFIAGKKALSGMARGGISNLVTQQTHNPSLDPVKAGVDVGFGMLGEAMPIGAKAGASKLWDTILKTPAKEAKEILLKGGKTIGRKVVDRGYMPASLKKLIGKAQKTGADVMPERDAIISATKANPKLKTILAPLEKELAKLKPTPGGPVAPGAKSAAKKLQEQIAETTAWVGERGSPQEVQQLKSLQQGIANKIYGKGPLGPTENVAKQAAEMTGRGARESLEEAAELTTRGQGTKLAELNKIYGESADIAEAAAGAAAGEGKKVGLGTAGLGTLGLSAAGLGQTEFGGESGIGKAAAPLLLMTAMSSPTGRMMIANMLKASAPKLPYPGISSLAPFLSGATKPLFDESE